MVFLELDRLAKRFGKAEVLREATLSVEEGETVAIVGPSGAGKTVLLRMIAGIVQADSGEIRIGGRPMGELGPEARGIGMAFQNFALYPHMSARENIASPLRARRLARAEIDRRVDEVAKLLRIDHVLAREPRRLSNGQKQRTALARSLVSGASLQMLDDPLRNVDAKLRYEMRFELPKLLKTFGATVLYVTQDYREAMAFGDRVAVLDEGAFVQVDRPSVVYAKPETVGIARLFGDPTINTYAVSASGGECPLFGTRLRLPLEKGGTRSCVIGIRPQDIEVHRSPAPGRIPMQLETVTPLNVRAAVLLRAETGEEVLAVAPEDAVPNLPGRHETVHVAIDPARLIAFDGETARRLETGR